METIDFPEDEKKKWIEWNLKAKMPLLLHRSLIRMNYPISEGRHTHCEFCWGEFGTDGYKVGYHVDGSEIWICEDCCAIFSDYFKWDVTEIG